MEYTDKQIEEAVKCVNSHGKIAISLEERQLYLNSMCRENPKNCTYDEMGFSCPNLICVNEYIGRQFSDEYMREHLKTDK